MLEFLESNASLVRMSAFIGVFIVMSGFEALLPKRDRNQRRGERWLTNLGLVVVSTIISRILFPVVAVGAAVITAENGWGLLNQFEISLWVRLLVSLIVLDLAIYWQHVASHKIPFLWRFHKVHHADRDIDASSGLRFHPVEIILSMMYKMLVVLVLGPSAVAVLLFEVVLNASAMFNHANLRIPAWLDKKIRILFVTPDMHRVHHSVIKKETDSNYGFNLSIWDRIFRSYRTQPKLGHETMTLGLPDYQTDKPSNLVWSLLLPFKCKLKQIRSEA